MQQPDSRNMILAIVLSMVVLFVNLLPAKQKTDLAPDERVAQYTAVTAGIQNPNAVIGDVDEADLAARPVERMGDFLGPGPVA